MPLRRQSHPAHARRDHPRDARDRRWGERRSRSARTLPRTTGTIQGMNTTDEIVSDVRSGRMVIVMDDETRENEADLIMAGEAVTPETVGFFVRHTSGIICQPMLRERLQQLRLPP